MDFLGQIYKFTSRIIEHNILASTAVTLACVAFIAALQKSKNKQKFWTERGIKGPKPYPFVGNILSLHTGNRLKKEREWVKKYGRVYGMYRGDKPHLVVADAETLQRICIKDFKFFTNRAAQEFAHKYYYNFLIALRDDHWKRTRALISPIFTSGKIKRMYRFLDGCADDLVESFKEQLPSEGPKQAKVNVKDLYNLFTMDAISTCCYGLKLERAGSTNLKTAAMRNEFVAVAIKMFQFSVVRAVMLATLPKRFLQLINFEYWTESDIAPLAAKMQQLIDQRRGSAKKFDDYLQLLIDAKLDDKMELNEMDSAENHHAGVTHESLLADQKQLLSDIAGGSGKVSMNDFEILSSAMFLLSVGLETTSTLLSHCTYALAFHPDIQERLNEELMKIAELDENKKKLRFDYEALTSCKYLDAVLSEALRLLSPVVQLEREASREYYLEKYDLVLPKDSKVALSYYAILNDSEYWPEPDRYDPERFMPENRDKIVSGSYCPFSLGPRHCAAMRFSLTEAKVALAKLVTSYRFEPAPGTQFPPEPKRVFAIHNTKIPIVIVKPRV